MEKNDAEINLAVNLPTSDFAKQLQKFERILKETKDSLNSFGSEMVDVADSVKLLGQRAKSTGSAQIVKSLEGGFSDGYGAAASMGARARKLEGGVAQLEGRAEKVQGAFTSGELSEDKAIALLQKYTAQAAQAREASSSLNYTLEATKGDLLALGELDELLAKWEQFTRRIDDTASGARGLAEELTAQADAFAEEREALDMAAPGYEQAAAKLLTLENEYRKMAGSATNSTKAVDGATAKIKEALAAYDGSGDAQKKVFDSISDGLKKAEDADKSLQKVVDDRNLKEQKRAAAEEKNAQKAEEKQKKAEEAAEKKAQKEEEMAAKREAREERLAQIEEENYEKDQYNMELALLGKRELIARIRELQKAREEAAKVNDSESYKKLTRQFMQAREQMEKVNVQMNIQKMAYMGQAQMVGRLTSAMDKVSEATDDLGEKAEEGELDLVGMAEGTMEMFSAMQAGLGPMGWFMLALQQLQDLLNDVAKHEKELEAIEQDHADTIKLEAEAYQAVADAKKEVDEENRRESILTKLRTQYDDLNTSLQAGLAFTEAATNAELRRLSIVADEATFQRTLKKDELGRALTAGTITRSQYEEAMLNLDADAVIAGASKRTKEAEFSQQKASNKRKKREEDFNQKLKMTNELRAQLDELGYSPAEIKAMEEQLKKLEQNYEKSAEKKNAARDAIKEVEPGVIPFVDIPSQYDWIIGSVFEDLGVEKASKLSRAKERYDMRVKQERAALRALNQFKAHIKKELGGRTFEDYLLEQDNIKSQLDIAQKEKDESFDAFEVSREEESAANKELENAQEDERNIRDKQGRLIASKKATLDAEEKAKEEQEQRTKRMEKLQQQVDKLSDDALKQKLEAARLAEKNAKNEHEREYQKALQKLYRDKLNKNQEAKNEAIDRAYAGISSERERRLMQKVDLSGAFATMDDDVLTIGELKKLRQEWKDANRAQNEEAVAIIRGLIEQAKNSKKTSLKTKNRIESLSW